MKYIMPILLFIALIFSACTPLDLPMDRFNDLDFENADLAAANAYPEPSPSPAAPIKVVAIGFLNSLQMQIVIEFNTPVSGPYGALIDNQRFPCIANPGNNKQILCTGRALPSGKQALLKLYSLTRPIRLVFTTAITIPAPSATLYPPPPNTPTRTPTPLVYPPPANMTSTATKTSAPVYPPPPNTPTRTPTPLVYPPPPFMTSTATKTSAPVYPPPPNTPTKTRTPLVYPPPGNPSPTATRTTVPTPYP